MFPRAWHTDTSFAIVIKNERGKKQERHKNVDQN